MVIEFVIFYDITDDFMENVIVIINPTALATVDVVVVALEILHSVQT